MLQSRTVLLSIVVALLANSAFASCTRNDYGVFEEIDCASEALSTAEAELDVVYKTLRRSLDRSQQRALVKAQRNWLAFVSAEVEFIYATEGDGSSGRLVVVNEREELMRARTKTLRNWVPR